MDNKKTKLTNTISETKKIFAVPIYIDMKKIKHVFRLQGHVLAM